MKVREWKVRKVLNSKAEPNIEVCINGYCSSPPSGTSRSSKEVNPFPRADTLDEAVNSAIHMARDVLKGLQGRDVEPVEVEENLVSEKGRMGGNTLLAISMALYKAGAAEEDLPLWRYLSEIFGTRPSLPRPLENTIGGGKHGGNTDIQEFLLFPSFEGSVEEWIHTLSQAYRDVKRLLKGRDPEFSGSLTLESAWVSGLPVEDILTLLSEVAEDYSLGLGVDVAASDIFDGLAYNWEKEGIVRDREAHMDYIVDLVNRYSIYYVEDPMDEKDPEGFVEIQRRIKGIVVGDDLFATNVDLLVEGIGGALIKYNQRGSILETVETVKKAREMGMKVVVSHRSGETEDPFLSHFAVAMGADLIKAGAAGIRIVKLNELLRIAESFSVVG